VLVHNATYIVDVAVCSGFVEGRGAIKGSSYALCLNGGVQAWGCNCYGQLGIGEEDWDDHEEPEEVVSGDQGSQDYLQGIIAISAGNFHVLALDNQGYVWSWGDNGFGQLGNGYTDDEDAPVQVLKDASTALSDIVYIDAGFYFSMALDKYGTVWVWGRNQYGQLGLGKDQDDQEYAKPMPIP